MTPFITTHKVLIIYTGGTIGMGKNPATGALEPLDFHHLMRSTPEFESLQTEVDVYEFDRPIDSSDISPTQWKQLVKVIYERYDLYDGFVVLHGTDTMAYTASALSFMLENLTKPVILTGSQLPIGQLRTDGKENIITSIELASMRNEQGLPVVPEVCIYFSGRLLRGNRATKQNAEGFNAFDSFNFPHLCEAGVTFSFNKHLMLQPDFEKSVLPHFEMNNNVLIMSLFPGMEERLVGKMLEVEDLRGLILRTYGSGNAPQKPWLLDLLRKATLNGTTIVNISQCVTGAVEMARYGTGFRLQDAGVVSGYDSTVEAAVTKLMYLQARYTDREQIRKGMKTNLRGEITL